MSNFYTAFIVALASGICEFTTYGYSRLTLGRPLVIGPVVGLVLGNVPLGVVIGATIELIFLGAIPIGAAIPANAAAATSISTALAILAGLDVAEATVIAVPVAVLAQLAQMLVWMLNASFLHMADKKAETGDIDAVARLHYGGMILFAIQSFVPTFLAVLFGVGLVEAVVNFLNVQVPFIMAGFRIASGILPALGFGMLFNMMDTKNFMPYFIIGFAAAAYFSGSLISVSIMGLAAALIHVKNMDVLDKREGRA